MTQEQLSILISTISTIVSPIFALWISETYIRRRNLEDTNRKQVLADLIGNRYKVESPEFMRAFNSIIMYWGKSDTIKKLVFEFRTATLERKTPVLIEIIYQLCLEEGISYLSREDIFNVFLNT